MYLRSNENESLLFEVKQATETIQALRLEQKVPKSAPLPFSI
jgi:hypothetical protein